MKKTSTAKSRKYAAGGKGPDQHMFGPVIAPLLLLAMQPARRLLAKPRNIRSQFASRRYLLILPAMRAVRPVPQCRVAPVESKWWSFKRLSCLWFRQQHQQ
jgi:hypothetical protein